LTTLHAIQAALSNNDLDPVHPHFKHSSNHIPGSKLLMLAQLRSTVKAKRRVYR